MDDLMDELFEYNRISNAYNEMSRIIGPELQQSSQPAQSTSNQRIVYPQLPVASALNQRMLYPQIPGALPVARRIPIPQIQPVLPWDSSIGYPANLNSAHLRQNTNNQQFLAALNLRQRIPYPQVPIYPRMFGAMISRPQYPVFQPRARMQENRFLQRNFFGHYRSCDARQELSSSTEEEPEVVIQVERDVSSRSTGNPSYRATISARSSSGFRLVPLHSEEDSSTSAELSPISFDEGSSCPNDNVLPYPVEQFSSFPINDALPYSVSSYRVNDLPSFPTHNVPSSSIGNLASQAFDDLPELDELATKEALSIIEEIVVLATSKDAPSTSTVKTMPSTSAEDFSKHVQNVSTSGELMLTSSDDSSSKMFSDEQFSTIFTSLITSADEHSSSTFKEEINQDVLRAKNQPPQSLAEDKSSATCTIDLTYSTSSEVEDMSISPNESNPSTPVDDLDSIQFTEISKKKQLLVTCKKRPSSSEAVKMSTESLESTTPTDDQMSSKLTTENIVNFDQNDDSANSDGNNSPLISAENEVPLSLARKTCLLTYDEYKASLYAAKNKPPESSVEIKDMPSIVETKVTPSVAETKVTPSVVETKVTPSVAKTKTVQNKPSSSLDENKNFTDKKTLSRKSDLSTSATKKGSSKYTEKPASSKLTEKPASSKLTVKPASSKFTQKPDSTSTFTKDSTPSSLKADQEPSSSQPGPSSIPKDKEYICHICEKGFIRKTSLLAHFGTHNGDEQYACRYCNKSFTNRADLHDHNRRRHLNDNPFPCSMCDCSFKSHRMLTKHLRIHRSRKLHRCDVCNETFSQYFMFKKHVCSFGQK